MFSKQPDPAATINGMIIKDSSGNTFTVESTIAVALGTSSINCWSIDNCYRNRGYSFGIRNLYSNNYN